VNRRPRASTGPEGGNAAAASLAASERGRVVQLSETDRIAERAAQAYREILARAPEHDLVPSLDRIAAVVGLLGDPQRSFRVVHLSGTNGKTSTTRMVERLLREHGLRTGRFISPHLNDVAERISLDGVPLGPERFVEVYREVLPYVELVDARSAEAGGPRMTFFEVLVAMAYAAFADAPVDVAVVEVGMGGSWDATNVADGEVAVITPIAIDHERFLGRDVASIAKEKAGIIKPGAVAVLGRQPLPAAEVLLRRAVEVGARVVLEGVEFGIRHREVAVGGQLVALQGLSGLYEDVFLPLHGAHQAANAACALAAVEAFLGVEPRDAASPGWTGLDLEVVRAGFAGVESPGRLEVVRRSPTVLVDAAHNPAGAAVVAEAVREAFAFTRLVGVVGILADKDAAGILEALEPVLDEVVITRSSSPRSIPPAELAAVATEVFAEDRVHVEERMDAAIETAVTLAEAGGDTGGGVLATGSVTVAADVRALLGAS
jgi:dihydrofolate synthase / folylpolyglutamate synthase